MQALLNNNEQAKNHGIDLSKLPQNMNMTAESITPNVHAINANCQPPNLHYNFVADNLVLNDVLILGPDDRMKFIFKSLVRSPLKKKFNI